MMNGNPPTLMRAIRGPIMLITIGVLFALDHMTQFSFARTWPAILIVLGLLSLGDRFSGPGPNPPTRPAPDFRGEQ
jgi:Domain of unknown function (DUF5668)